MNSCWCFINSDKCWNMVFLSDDPLEHRGFVLFEALEADQI